VSTEGFLLCSGRLGGGQGQQMGQKVVERAAGCMATPRELGGNGGTTSMGREGGEGEGKEGGASSFLIASFAQHLRLPPSKRTSKLTFDYHIASTGSRKTSLSPKPPLPCLKLRTTSPNSTTSSRSRSSRSTSSQPSTSTSAISWNGRRFSQGLFPDNTIGEQSLFA